MVAYGSEFRPATDLDHLLSHHPDWSALCNNITHGINYPLIPIEDDTRIAGLHQTLKHENHKSATGKANKKVLANHMTDDVNLGYSIPLPIKILPKILFAKVYPLGVQHQQSIDKMGNVIMKDRVSHNLPFPKDSLAFNDRVITDLLEPWHYGHSLCRVCHYIHNL
eukprot:12515494-Ditylum_brightwellii.AAC.1